MDEKTEGIILRVRPMTETSLVVRWLTPGLGRIATVAKGARRPKSPFQGKLDLGHHAEFNFQRSHRSDLHVLRELRVLDRPAILRTDLRWLQIFAAAVELLERSTETDTPLPGFFPIFNSFLLAFDSRHDPAVALYACQIRFLRELGFPPESQPNLTPGSRQLLEKLGNLDWPLLHRLNLSAQQRAELGFFLRKFIADHLDIHMPNLSI